MSIYIYIQYVDTSTFNHPKITLTFTLTVRYVLHQACGLAFLGRFCLKSDASSVAAVDKAARGLVFNAMEARSVGSGAFFSGWIFPVFPVKKWICLASNYGKTIRKQIFFWKKVGI